MTEKHIPELLVEPNKFCPGCGHGVINRVVAEVLEESGLAEQAVGALAVGCACLMMDTFGTDWIQAPPRPGGGRGRRRQADAPRVLRLHLSG